MNKRGKLNKRWEYIIRGIKEKKFVNIVEIGVGKGKTTEHVLKNCYNEINQYYCVDRWEFYDEYVSSLNPNGAYLQQNMDNVYKEFLERTKPYIDKIEVLRYDSKEASMFFEDGSVCLCFIDANHSYKYIKRDIEYGYPKVKFGGIISGHDFKQTDVAKVVTEKFNKNELNVKKKNNMGGSRKTKTSLNQ